VETAGWYTLWGDCNILCAYAVAARCCNCALLLLSIDIICFVHTRSNNARNVKRMYKVLMDGI